jgi:dihydroorotate dehydrogenase electron transfer subunit
MSAGEVEIVANVPAAREHSFLTLAAPEVAKAARPGQFAMLRVPGTYDPLLPRAFSFYGVDAQSGQVTFLYRVVGKGTRLLAAQQAGSRLQIWGPLGHGFERPEGPALLVGGGVGIPPLVHFASDCGSRIWDREVSTAESAEHAERDREKARTLEAVFGFATAEFVVGGETLQAAGVPLQIATDDGTRGHHGRVTDLLQTWLTEHQNTRGAEIRNPKSEIRNPRSVLACGPHAMLAAVARLCEAAGVPAQLALEAPMACGVGACIGCTVPRREGGYARVCTDGPVFRADEINWGEP